MTDNSESKNMNCKLFPCEQEDQGTRSTFPKERRPRSTSPAFDINRYTVSQLYQQSQENKAMCLDMEERLFQRIWNDEVDNATEMDRLSRRKDTFQCGRCNTEFEYVGAFNFHTMFKCSGEVCEKKKNTVINRSCYICIKVFGPNSRFCYHEHNGMNKPDAIVCSDDNKSPYSRSQTEQRKQPKDTKENLSTDSCNRDKGPTSFNCKPFSVKRVLSSNFVKQSRQKKSKKQNRAIPDSSSNYVATDQQESEIRTENIHHFSESKDDKPVFFYDNKYQTPPGCTQKEECGIFDI